MAKTKTSLRQKLKSSLHFRWKYQPYKHIIIIGGILYLFLYLWAIGDLAYSGGYPLFQTAISEDPWSRIYQARAAFYFESVALLEVFNVTFILSPLNLLMGILLAVLVGLNFASSWLAIKLPKICGTKKGFLGILGSLPALFSGLACCVPTIVLIVSVQLATAIVALRSFFFPVGVVLLVLSQLWSAHKLNPVLLKQEEKKRKEQHEKIENKQIKIPTAPSL